MEVRVYQRVMRQRDTRRARDLIVVLRLSASDGNARVKGQMVSP